MGKYIDLLSALPGKIGKVKEITKVIGVKGSSFVLNNLYVPQAPSFAPMDGMHFMENMGILYATRVWPKILSEAWKVKIDDMLANSTILPSHWGRKPRELFAKPGPKSWKAEEWHNFILHSSLIVLEGALPRVHYKGADSFK